MTSKLAKTLDELCTKVRMSHLFSPRNRKLSLFTNKKKDCIKLHKLFHHTHFFVPIFNQWIWGSSFSHDILCICFYCWQEEKLIFLKHVKKVNGSLATLLSYHITRIDYCFWRNEIFYVHVCVLKVVRVYNKVLSISICMKSHWNKVYIVLSLQIISYISIYDSAHFKFITIIFHKKLLYNVCVY